MAKLPPVRACLLTLLLLAAGFAGGCATAPKTIAFPYAMPAAPSASEATAPAAEIVNVSDVRTDRSLDMFLDERAVDFVRKALAAELQAGGAFTSVAAQASTTAPAAVSLDLELRDLSWAVPNHDRMVKTAFWTSFLTGGIGGLAYGSTETPVFGHAAFSLKATDRASGKLLFNDVVEAVHEEKTAKLKCDSLETRARVMAAALKKALTKATEGIAKARATPPATPAT